ncbi:MAG: cell division protein ZapA [Cytophagales bacterium]|nr:cell division protein ZapA [Cytophagales bacterium]
MGELSIKIKIADREYPMKVKPEDEEVLRSAGKVLNDRIKELRNTFRIDDRQDLLAMVAFDSMVRLTQQTTEKEKLEELCDQELGRLHQLVDLVLNE